jgi:hypothetical protein
MESTRRCVFAHNWPLQCKINLIGVTQFRRKRVTPRPPTNCESPILADKGIMDIFFQDPDEVPLPPDEVRIREVFAEPWPDRRRVRVYLEFDPFQRRPSAELLIFNGQGDEVAQTNIVEAFTRKIELNMHLRESNPAGKYILKTLLYYIPKPEGEDIENETETQTPLVVDERQFEFIISDPGDVKE